MQLQKIETKIYEVRGQRIMFDFDLAELYEVETRVLNQAVKRPKAALPLAFTEHGVAMLANVLKSKKRYLPYAFSEQGLATN